MRKLILSNSFSPGDIVVFTAAVRQTVIWNSTQADNSGVRVASHQRSQYPDSMQFPVANSGGIELLEISTV